jgi:hypothetical protein
MELWFARPARIPAGLAQLILAAEFLVPQSSDVLPLGVNRRLFVDDVGPRISLSQRLLWIGVILHAQIAQLALMKREIGLRLPRFRAQRGKAPAPFGLALRLVRDVEGAVFPDGLCPADVPAAEAAGAVPTTETAAAMGMFSLV